MKLKIKDTNQIHTWKKLSVDLNSRISRKYMNFRITAFRQTSSWNHFINDIDMKKFENFWPVRKILRNVFETFWIRWSTVWWLVYKGIIKGNLFDVWTVLDAYLWFQFKCENLYVQQSSPISCDLKVSRDLILLVPAHRTVFKRS